LKLFVLISLSVVFVIVVIYWFELDYKFLRAFEPTFRKIVVWVKDKNLLKD
jgi:hypothetical protein